MKPVALTLKGLHSFREAQEVDFVRLCEGGVFGIFGPTGSGKSTLLDAVTLALYGKVERAANNTQGIMNHAEEELVVSFCFELGEGDGRRRYRVERSFKRTGEHGVRTAACRLLEETAQGTVVLADKAGAVNEKVEELLGLSSDDFTRAVVLPQGKFAEFLTLKGAERREMLQRIFNLEQYGDAMREKLNRRAQETKTRLEAVEAEQLGLGDASEEALRAAEEKVRSHEVQLAQAKQRLAELEHALERMRRLWEWQQERQALQRQLRQLAEKDAEMARLETVVARAEEAQRLLPYAEELLAVRLAVQRGRQQWTEAVRVIQQAERRKSAAAAAYEAAQAQRATQEPLLLARLEQLNQARQLAARMAQMARELEVLERRQGELAEQRAAAGRRREELERRQQEMEARQHQRKAQLAERQVSAEERRQILQAYRDKGEIDHWTQRVREERDELRAKQRELTVWREKQAEAGAQGMRAREAAEGLLARVRERLAAAAGAQEQLTRLQAVLVEQREVRQAALEAAKINRLAHALARELEDGRPCPVCGSTEHPAPAREASDEATQRLELQLEQLKQWLHEAEAVRFQLTNVQWPLQQLAEQLSAELGASDGAGAGRDDAVPADGLPPRLDEPEPETAAARVPSMGNDAADGESLIRDYGSLAVQLEQQAVLYKKEAEGAIRRLREAKRLQEEVAVRIHHAETVCRQQADKVATLERNLEEKRRAWSASYPGRALADIEAQQKRLEALDREADALRKELERGANLLEEIVRHIGQLKETEHRLSLEWTALAGQIQEKRHGWQTWQAELTNITQGNDPEMLWREVQQALVRLKQGEQEAGREQEAAMNGYQEAAQRMAAARQSLEEARERLQKAEAQWAAQVQRLRETAPASGWTDLHRPEGVREALLPQEKLEQYKVLIQNHRDAKNQITARLQEVVRQLDGQSLSQEEWEAMNRRWQEAKADVNRWFEARGAVVEAWKILQEKHRRYTELERRKKEWASLYEKYSRLQQVFKGNAFVEFLAEEHLIRISRDASQRLKSLTRGRYALEVDSGGGFVIRDDANGGVKRPVSSLSGGETFLTSLALALSLSASIQLRGRYPLQFFFLDEGFGTLDQELLDTVVTALERLHGTHMAIGVISHVPELQARLPRRLMVEPAEPGGRGSRVRLEVM